MRRPSPQHSTKKRRSKYGAVKVEADGRKFDSKREHKRYCQLKVLEMAGEIERLELQPRYRLMVDGHDCGAYVADFRYRDAKTGELTVEDAKGFRTDLYKLKRKLVKAIYGIEIVEV